MISTAAELKPLWLVVLMVSYNFTHRLIRVLAETGARYDIALDILRLVLSFISRFFEG